MTIVIQDTYLTDYAQGQPGMLADGTTQDRVTGIVADAAGLAFGKAAFGTGTGRQVTGTPGGKFKGISIATATLIAPVGGSADVYPQYASATLLDNGNIWVTAAATVAKDAAVYVTSAGAFTSTASGNTAIPATFLDAGSNGSNVRIRVVQQ
ncbi:MAG: hypothetical protein PGN16_04240 [Sphingomonas phyllosphaerae]|uniref:structural cement protein Gp24 n=1 Tax=Sphingomonas phyllosphaerae TaxID=257003 RepID=UPI002FF8BCB7